MSTKDPHLTGSGQQLYAKAKRVIPGGTQLLSKRPEMFLPEGWPSYYSRAKGIEVWDLDGRSYFDFTHNGVGTCPLGYADPDVDAAVTTVIEQGSMSTLNSPQEIELAELLFELHPWAEMARFGRCGGEAAAMAVRIARAHTGRDKIAFCGYHGWHDWYLAANLASSASLDGHLLPGLSPRGVPRGLAGTAFPFAYNKPESLHELFQAHPEQIAAVIMEPVRSEAPQPGFLEEVQALAKQHGSVFIVDEVTSGFRLNTGGVHLLHGLKPDMAVFAKGMSNGYPMAAIIGRAEVMNAAQGTFISSTYWTEGLGPAAALAAIRKHRLLNLGQRLTESGNAIREVWKQAAQKAGLDIKINGIPPLSHFAINHAQGQAARTLFTQRLLENGFLASASVYTTLGHTPEAIARYGREVEKAFAEIAELLRTSPQDIEKRLNGPVAHSGFARLT
jgi:glutamate-1-semialdehyde aminotransferase